MWNMKGAAHSDNSTELALTLQCISFTSTDLYSVLLFTVCFTLNALDAHDFKQRHAAAFSEESSDKSTVHYLLSNKEQVDKVID